MYGSTIRSLWYFAALYIVCLKLDGAARFSANQPSSHSYLLNKFSLPSVSVDVSVECYRVGAFDEPAGTD